MPLGRQRLQAEDGVDAESFTAVARRYAQHIQDRQAEAQACKDDSNEAEGGASLQPQVRRLPTIGAGKALWARTGSTDNEEEDVGGGSPAGSQRRRASSMLRLPSVLPQALARSRAYTRYIASLASLLEARPGFVHLQLLCSFVHLTSMALDIATAVVMWRMEPLCGLAVAVAVVLVLQLLAAAAILAWFFPGPVRYAALALAIPLDVAALSLYHLLPWFITPRSLCREAGVSRCKSGSSPGQDASINGSQAPARHDSADLDDMMRRKGWGAEKPSVRRICIESGVFVMLQFLASHRPARLLTRAVAQSAPMLGLQAAGLARLGPKGSTLRLLTAATTASSLSLAAAAIELTCVGRRVVRNLAPVPAGLPDPGPAAPRFPAHFWGRSGGWTTRAAAALRVPVCALVCMLQYQAGLLLPARWCQRMQQHAVNLPLHELLSLSHIEACVVLQHALDRPTVTLTNVCGPAAGGSARAATNRKTAVPAPHPSATLLIQTPYNLQLVPQLLGYPVVLAASAVTRVQCPIMARFGALHPELLPRPPNALSSAAPSGRWTSGAAPRGRSSSLLGSPIGNEEPSVRGGAPASRALTARSVGAASLVGGGGGASMRAAAADESQQPEPQVTLQLGAPEGCRVKTNDVAACFHTLMPCWVTDLVVSDIKLQLEAYQALARHLEDPRCALRSIRLKEAHMSMVALKALCGALATNASVSALDLSSNRLGVLGPRAPQDIANLLATNATLQELKLAYTGLGSEAVAEVLLGAVRSVSLTRLDLSQNRVTDVLPAALLLAVPRTPPPPLTHLNLGFNRIQDCLGPWLVLVLTHCPLLTHVWMEFNAPPPTKSATPSRSTPVRTRPGAKASKVSRLSLVRQLSSDLELSDDRSPDGSEVSGGKGSCPAPKLGEAAERGLALLAHLEAHSQQLDHVSRLQFLDLSGVTMPLEFKACAPAEMRCGWLREPLAPVSASGAANNPLAGLPIAVPDELTGLLRMPGALLDLGSPPWSELGPAQRVSALYVFARHQPRLLITNAPAAVAQQRRSRRRSGLTPRAGNSNSGRASRRGAATPPLQASPMLSRATSRDKLSEVSTSLLLRAFASSPGLRSSLSRLSMPSVTQGATSKLLDAKLAPASLQRPQSRSTYPLQAALQRRELLHRQGRAGSQGIQLPLSGLRGSPHPAVRSMSEGVADRAVEPPPPWRRALKAPPGPSAAGAAPASPAPATPWQHHRTPSLQSFPSPRANGTYNGTDPGAQQRLPPLNVVSQRGDVASHALRRATVSSSGSIGSAARTASLPGSSYVVFDVPGAGPSNRGSASGSLDSQPEELWVSYAARPDVNSAANAMVSGSTVLSGLIPALGLLYTASRAASQAAASESSTGRCLDTGLAEDMPAGSQGGASTVSRAVSATVTPDAASARPSPPAPPGPAHISLFASRGSATAKTAARAATAPPRHAVSPSRMSQSHQARPSAVSRAVLGAEWEEAPVDASVPHPSPLARLSCSPQVPGPPCAGLGDHYDAVMSSGEHVSISADGGLAGWMIRRRGDAGRVTSAATAVMALSPADAACGAALDDPQPPSLALGLGGGGGSQHQVNPGGGQAYGPGSQSITLAAHPGWQAPSCDRLSTAADGAGGQGSLPRGSPHARWMALPACTLQASSSAAPGSVVQQQACQEEGPSRQTSYSGVWWPRKHPGSPAAALAAASSSGAAGSRATPLLLLPHLSEASGCDSGPASGSVTRAGASGNIVAAPASPSHHSSVTSASCRQPLASVTGSRAARVRGTLMIGRFEAGNALHAPLKELLLPIWSARQAGARTTDNTPPTVSASSLAVQDRASAPAALTSSRPTQPPAAMPFAGLSGSTRSLNPLLSSDSVCGEGEWVSGPDDVRISGTGSEPAARPRGSVPDHGPMLLRAPSPALSIDIMTLQLLAQGGLLDSWGGVGDLVGHDPVNGSQRDVRLLLPNAISGPRLLELHLVGVPESQDAALDALLQMVGASHPAYAARAALARGTAPRRVAHFSDDV